MRIKSDYSGEDGHKAKDENLRTPRLKVEVEDNIEQSDIKEDRYGMKPGRTHDINDKGIQGI